MAAAAASSSLSGRHVLNLVDVAWAGETKEYDTEVINKAKVSKTAVMASIRFFCAIQHP
jgi:hypothetical protein